MVAAKSAVTQPTIATTSMAIGACEKSGCERATMYTPAVTMVAAWISALTGVGPSIASGSQTYSGSCADLPVAPTNSSSADRREHADLPASSAGIRGERREDRARNPASRRSRNTSSMPSSEAEIADAR